jgi:hypothetical protein
MTADLARGSTVDTINVSTTEPVEEAKNTCKAGSITDLLTCE